VHPVRDQSVRKMIAGCDLRGIVALT